MWQEKSKSLTVELLALYDTDTQKAYCNTSCPFLMETRVLGGIRSFQCAFYFEHLETEKESQNPLCTADCKKLILGETEHA